MRLPTVMLPGLLYSRAKMPTAFTPQPIWALIADQHQLPEYCEGIYPADNTIHETPRDDIDHIVSCSLTLDVTFSHLCQIQDLA
jgi:hypothetical protein